MKRERKGVQKRQCVEGDDSGSRSGKATVKHVRGYHGLYLNILKRHRERLAGRVFGSNSS